MDNLIIQKRLNSYHCTLPEHEENALKEIMQEIILAALARVEFFKVAEFHGGTALRILYGLQRFSEDLDFVLQEPDPAFDFSYYLKKIENEFSYFGIDAEIKDRSKANSAVKKAFLKDNSIGKQLTLTFPVHEKNRKKICIKLEIDTYPPMGATFDMRKLTFPLHFSIITKDLPSSFSGKMHALLCRSHLKGRDWYDFLWYVENKTPLNFTLLQNAIDQTGPWEKQKITVDAPWVLEQLRNKIHVIDWKLAKKDVLRFVRDIELPNIEAWSSELFMDSMTMLESSLRV